MTTLTAELIARLQDGGVECLLSAGYGLPDDSVFEPPCSVKWMNAEYKLSLKAFSYAVRGFFFNVEIGRYTSIGEDVQIGRGDHPTSWVSTSPAFYVPKLFSVGNEFVGSELYHAYQPSLPKGVTPTLAKTTKIGNDVYIGHGAFVRPGVTIGDGAIVAAYAVVLRDVPPYSVVAGNPATVRKSRVPGDLVQPLIATQWWRFAPWQLKGLNLTEPRSAVRLLEKVCPKLNTYEPGTFSLQSLL